jgi:hypothetical protein
MSTTLRAVTWLAAVAVLLGVFALYLQPGFVFTLAQQMWSCF